MKTLLPLLLGVGVIVSAAPAQTGVAVTITESATDYVLSNGIVTARVLKRNGDLASLKFRDAEMLNDKSGHPGAYWSHDTTGGTELISRITIDSKTNNGTRAEVSVKGVSGGKKMGHGPGVPQGAEGDLPVDIEIRYTLGRGDSGIHTYCAFTHRPEYPAATMTEARFAAKLADTFDWMTVDAKRDQHFPATLREGDKYMYTANQFENRAFGWSSTRDRVGFWLLNPSVEFLSGGPTKTEFGMPLKYAALFSNDVNFVVGKSDPRRDWFFQHVPHNEDAGAKSVPFRGITTPGRATPFAITFNLADTTASRGTATLRVAICGGGAREIGVAVNGQSAGKIDRLLVDGAITRHSIRGLWYEREIAFDAALLKPGTNTLTLTVPAGPVNNGVIYDCLRLELDETAL